MSPFNHPILKKIKIYRSNDDNFPELDNVKSIFQNISDWCFINNENQPIFNKTLLRINNGVIDSMLTNFRLLKMESEDYCKSFIVTVYISYYKSKEKSLNDLVTTTCKRLENYGFTVKKTIMMGGISGDDDHPDEKTIFTIYILDTSDTISVDEIKKLNETPR